MGLLGTEIESLNLLLSRNIGETLRREMEERLHHALKRKAQIHSILTSTEETIHTLRYLCGPCVPSQTCCLCKHAARIEALEVAAQREIQAVYR